MKRRSVLSLTLAIALGFGGIFTHSGEASAASLSDLQNEQSNILNKRSNVDNSIGEKDGQISEIIDKQTLLEDEMKRLELQIANTDNKINEKEKEIKDTKAEIEKLKAEIEELKIRIEKRNEMLRERARNIQMNGGSVKYIDVLLGAESFGDFVDRVSAVTTLVNADKEIIEEQKADKEKLEINQAEVEKKLASLNNMLKELEGLKADLKNQNARKKQVMKELSSQKKHIESEKMALEEEAEVLKAQEAAISKAINQEKERIAEEERKAREEAARLERERKAAEEAERARAAKDNQVSNPIQESKPKQPESNNSTSPVRSGGGGGSSVGAPPVTSGMFMRPAQGYISSGFGGRSLGNHFGIDIAAAGTVPVVASAGGVVSMSYFSPSYGNVVFVTHHLNGQTYTTVYAHLSSRSVSAGSSVSKGQLLGYMGNTGQSYGQHLHFELHVGAWNGAKSNAVDPRRYVNF